MKTKLFIGILLGIVYGIFRSLATDQCNINETIFVSPLPVEGHTATPTAAPTAMPTPFTPQPPPTPTKWVGMASYYSENGCLGCSATLTMANGEKLDDDALTLAFNMAPLNKMVMIENQRNGKKVMAKITDRGGFHKYNRIADLSLAAAKAIELKTDIDTLTITLVK